jgi:hypothetical protein
VGPRESAGIPNFIRTRWQELAAAGAG